MLSVSVAGGPAQAILRPSRIEDPALAEMLEKEALLGTRRLFERSEGTQANIDHGALILEQGGRAIRLNPQGGVLIRSAPRASRKVTQARLSCWISKASVHPDEVMRLGPTRLQQSLLAFWIVSATSPTAPMLVCSIRILSTCPTLRSDPRRFRSFFLGSLPSVRPVGCWLIKRALSEPLVGRSTARC